VYKQNMSKKHKVARYLIHECLRTSLRINTHKEIKLPNVPKIMKKKFIKPSMLVISSSSVIYFVASKVGFDKLVKFFIAKSLPFH